MVLRSQTPKQLVPGLNAIFGMEYKQYPDLVSLMFEMGKSNRAFEEEVIMPGFGAALQKAEGSAVSYADTSEGWVSRYNMLTYALAFNITEEAVEDNLYMSIAARLSKALARSMYHTKELVGANIFNNGFLTTAAYQGGDGVGLFHTAHPRLDGGTYRNRPATDVDLSEASLEAACTDIRNFTDDNGLPVMVQPKRLLIPSALEFTAERILGSLQRSGTADNDTNALRSLGKFSGGVVINQRFTDTDAWFITTDAPDGLKGFNRTPLATRAEGDFESGNMRYKARERYAFGWSNPRGAYGSQGA